MRTVVAPLSLAAFLLVSALPADGARPASNRGPLRDLSDAKTRASSPIDLQVLATGDLSGVPSATFDPAKVDQIETAFAGRLAAWTTTLSDVGIPGTSRDVILLREGKGRVRVSDAAGDNDQPSVGIDSLGARLVWRGSDGVRGTTPGNLWVRSTHVKPGTPSDGNGDGNGNGNGNGDGNGTPMAVTEEVVTEQITKLVATEDPTDPKKIVGTAYEPSLCARTRVREIDAGIKLKERDARIAFVSTGDLDRGRNLEGFPQLFVWYEQAREFVQITSIEDEGFAVNRPSIDASGSRVAFECSADLTPDAVDPKTTTRIGNPDGVRQIYLWQAGRGLRQLTWSDRDCLAPRLSRDGRFVVFCSRGDLIPGANPDGNFEIFEWAASRDRSREMRQMTRTDAGDNVLPRPGRTPSAFAFWSTSETDSVIPLLPASLAAFRVPLAYVRRGGRTVLVGGWTYDEQDTTTGNRFLSLVPGTTPGTYEYPVLCGPPCLAGEPTTPLFVTNDIALNAEDADDDLDGKNGGTDPDGDPLPDDRAIDASILSYHVARSRPRASR